VPFRNVYPGFAPSIRCNVPVHARQLAVALAAALAAPAALAASYEAGPANGRILVHVQKRGLFSMFAHDHHFEVTRWRATAEIPDGGPPPASVAVDLEADSLRDRQESLSDGDRRKVDAQAAGPEVLDAAHHPRVEFRGQRLEVEPGGGPEHVRGKLHGTLTVRGRTAPVDVAVEADRGPDGWRVRGRARVKQTDLGITPFSGFGGTVGVKDERELEIALTLRPRAP
jgi:polyisoprenoid-binding protein YceI